jgi:hypothetical protein
MGSTACDDPSPIVCFIERQTLLSPLPPLVTAESGATKTQIQVEQPCAPALVAKHSAGGPPCRSGAEGEEMTDWPTEERVIGRDRFQAQLFDFRGKIVFTRFDGCEFVKCILLIDHDTEQLTFTECVFKDCNIDKLEQDEERGLYVRDNFFDRPLEERRAEFENRLAQAQAARKAKGK